ncbi:MAG: hypothetical protein IPM39_01735 [Chloroflexi bacterium]|nr:hypothetical protein [Chloroflexota bacterium]
MIEQMKNRWLDVVPLAVDGLSVLALVGVLGTAVTRLQTTSGLNVLYLLAAYILMCAGVFLLRKLEPAPDAGAWPADSLLLARPTRMVLGILFGLVTMTVMAFQFGYFASILVVDTLALGEGESATLFAFAPGAWLGLSLVYTVFLALPVTPTVGWGDGRYPWQAFLGLLFVNVMLLFLTAQIRAVLNLVQASGGMGLFLLTFLLFLLLFGPPRLIYLAKQRNIGGATFVILTAAAAWLAAW